MNVKKYILLFISITLIFVFAIFCYYDRSEMLDVEIEFSDGFGTDSNLFVSLNNREKLEQKDSSATVYIFRGSLGRSMISVINTKNMELVEKERRGKTVYLKIKESEVQESIKGNNVGKLIEIITEEDFTNVVVTEEK